MLRTTETYPQSTNLAELNMAEIQVYLKLWSWSSDNNVINLVQSEEYYWRYSALSREACLLAYSTQYYWLCSNCVWLVGTSKAILEWVYLLSQQPNLDYYSKSMTDPPHTIFSVKKPSPISAVIADRLADTWPHREGESDGVRRSVFSFLFSWRVSFTTWCDFLKVLLSTFCWYY